MKVLFKPRDLGALKAIFPSQFCLQLPTSKPILWKGSKILVWWKSLLEPFPQLTWEPVLPHTPPPFPRHHPPHAPPPHPPRKSLIWLESQLYSSDLRCLEFLHPRARVFGLSPSESQLPLHFISTLGSGPTSPEKELKRCHRVLWNHMQDL